MLNKKLFRDEGDKVSPALAEKRVYTLKDMALMFSVSLRTIYNWIDQGKFGYVKVGSKTYVTEQQIQEFLERHQVNAPKAWRA